MLSNIILSANLFGSRNSVKNHHRSNRKNFEVDLISISEMHHRNGIIGGKRQELNNCRSMGSQQAIFDASAVKIASIQRAKIFWESNLAKCGFQFLKPMSRDPTVLTLQDIGAYIL